MRGMWVLGVVVIVGACGADEPASSALSTSALGTTTEPTTAAPVTTALPATSAAVSASTTAAVVATEAPVVSITAPEALGLDGEWRVSSGVVDGEPVQLLDGSPITLTAVGSMLSGSAPCNSYEFTIEARAVGVEIVDGCRDFTGTWATDGTIINTSDVSIDGSCVGPLADVDEIVAQVLNEGFAATIDGDRLSARPRDNLGLDFFAD